MKKAKSSKCWILFLILITSISNASAKRDCFLEDNKDPVALTEEQLALINQTNVPSYKIGDVNISSFFNFDVKPKTMQKSLPGEGEKYLELSNLGITAQTNLFDCIKPNVSIAYYGVNKGQADGISNNTGLILDDAYVTIADFSKYPVYLQAGRMYLPFGRYDRYVITPSLVQMLTEIRANTVQVGVIKYYPNKFGASFGAYLYQGVLTKDKNKIQGDLGSGFFANVSVPVSKYLVVRTGVQYIYNMLNVNSLAQGGVFDKTNDKNSNVSFYQNLTNGLALQAELDFCYFNLFGKYVTAIRNSKDLVHFRKELIDQKIAVHGAKPSAIEVGIISDIEKLLSLPVMLDFSYQRTEQTAGLFVFNALASDTHPFPKVRYIVGITIKMHKNAHIRLQWGHNFLYPMGQGDNRTQGDDATIRLSVFI